MRCLVYWGKYKKIALPLLFLFFLLSAALAQTNKYYETAIYTDEYGLSIYPDYPVTLGEEITLRLRPFTPAQKVTLYSDREEKIPMTYREGHWWGRFKIPEDYQIGWHFFTVWTRKIMFSPRGLQPVWSKSLVWYRAYQAVPPTLESLVEPAAALISSEALPQIEGLGTSEASPLVIKGSQSMTFKRRSLTGTKEGYAAGDLQTREETLRINVSGQSAGAEIEASLFRTTSTGITQLGEQNEKVSILLKRDGTELYLGDFTADLSETEFARLNQVLSGARVKGDYERWGFLTLYSSPRGTSQSTRTYGAGTQGPYNLGKSPVVIDSERVFVDGIERKRGDDYTVDYQAGTIKFLKQVIDPKSIIQVYYDYRQTVYQHSTAGLRTYYKPYPGLKVAATYLNDSDGLDNAAQIRSSMSTEAVNPASHYILGADANLVSENLSANAEIAYSLKNLNLLSASATEESGRAVSLDLSTSLGSLGLKAHAKRISSQFQSLSDPDPKQALWDYGAALSFRPNSLLASQGNYASQKYTQGAVIYENLYKNASLKITPDQRPSFEYLFSETDESNDPVSGSPMQRVITRNSIETIYQRGPLASSLKSTVEKWLRRSPSEEATNYKRVNLGVSTVGLETFSLASNLEIENREEPTGLKPFRRAYDFNLSATPSQKFFVASAFSVVDDSQLGKTNVVDLTYRAEPLAEVKTEGKYTISSVEEDFPVTKEAVSKQSGSLSLDLRPHRALRLRYFYKPNFTRILRTDTLSYNNEQQQTEINVIPTKYALLGLIYKVGRTYSVAKDDYPNYSLKERSEDSDSTLYTFKIAPASVLSTEFNYLLENSHSLTLASTVEPYTYTSGQIQNKKFEALIKTSLSEQFSIDSRYTYQKSDRGSGEAGSNIVNAKSHTASLKGIWNPGAVWTFSLSTAYSRATDYLASQVTYTLAPGFGLIYRLGDNFRLDFDYTYSKSSAGEEKEVEDYDLKAKYTLSEYVNVLLRFEQEIGRSPYYRLTDITGNVEINL